MRRKYVKNLFLKVFQLFDGEEGGIDYGDVVKFCKCKNVFFSSTHIKILTRMKMLTYWLDFIYGSDQLRLKVNTNLNGSNLDFFFFFLDEFVSII